MPSTHYPPLSSLVDASAIPGDIEFLENNAQAAIDAVLGKVFYKNLYVDTSFDGTQSFYSLTLLSKSLRLPLFGTGLELVFFHGSDAAYSEFPIEFHWRWNIRKYIAGFEAEGFAYTPEAVMDVLFSMAGIENFEDFTGQIVDLFLDDGSNVYINVIDEIISTLNAYRDGSAAVDAEIQNIQDRLVEIKDEVSNLLTSSNEFTLSAIFSVYSDNPVISPAVESISQSISHLSSILDIDVNIYADAVKALLKDIGDIEEKFKRLFKLFEKWLGEITLEKIGQILIPQFSLGLKSINMALEFPRDYLLPMKLNGTVWEVDADPTHRAGIVFTAGGISYSTETGFEISIDDSNQIDLPRCVIPNLELQLEFIKVKLDLSRTSNISEAIADGRPEDFIGAYIQEANIWLPDEWFQFDEDGSTLQLYAKDIIVGTGGLSGIIGVKAAARLNAALQSSMLLKDGKTISISAGSDGKINEGDSISLDGSPIEDGRYLLKAGGILIAENGAIKEFLSSDGELSFKLGKKDGGSGQWEIGFSQFYMKFWQNKIKESEIKGFLTIPNFKQEGKTGPLRVDISVFFEDDGDFRITATPKDGLKICLGDNGSVLKVKIKSLAAGKDNNKVYLEVSGAVDFSNNPLLSAFITQPIEVKKLRIYSDGSFEIEGGSIPIPVSVHLNLGPVEVDITNITLGAETLDKGPYKFIGFDCGVSTGSGGLDLRGDGIKIYFNHDGSDMFLRIAGIGVNLIIPGTATEETAALIVKGYLALREAEYVGAVAFKLPKANIAGGAAMKMKPKVPAFAIDAFLELSAPIPLGQTGLGIFGFRGMFGLRYIANLPPGATSDPDKLFEFYTNKVPNPLNGNLPEKGIHLGKIVTPDERPEVVNSGTPISIGAGISLGTAVDAGRAFSMQAFLFLSLPELLMISGRGNVLGERVSIVSETEPPFFAYLAFSTEFISIGLGAEYKISREEGEFLELNADAQLAFFFNDFSAWYVHFGTKEDPNKAKLLKKIFELDAYAYLMLSAAGIETGAGVRFDFEKKYGPVKVEAHAYGDVYAMISFRKPQVGGGIAVGGSIKASVFGVGFNLSIDTYLMLTVPTPFIVKGGARICLEVDLWITTWRKCFEVEFKWTFENNNDLTEVFIIDQIPFPVSALHIASQSTYPLTYFRNALPSPTDLSIEAIPLDSYVDIQFKKSVNPAAVSTKIGSFSNPPTNNIELIPPCEVEKQVTHQYEIVDVNIKVWNNTTNAWVNYHPYEALDSSAFLQTVNPSDLRLGHWQKKGSDYNTIRLLSTTPFSFTDNMSGEVILEQFGVTWGTLFCESSRKQCHCIRWSGSQNFTNGIWYNNQAVKFKVTKTPATVVSRANVFTIPESLRFRNQSTFDLIFPERVLKATIKLSSDAKRLKVSYYDLQDKQTVQGGIIGNQAVYVLVKEVTLTSSDFSTPLVYEHSTQTIKKITVEAERQDEVQIIRLKDQLLYLHDQLLEGNKEAAGQIQQLEGQLAKLEAFTCIDKPKDKDPDPKLQEHIRDLEARIKELKKQLEEITRKRSHYCGLYEVLTQIQERYRKAREGKFFLVQWILRLIEWIITTFKGLRRATALCQKYTHDYNAIAEEIKMLALQLEKLKDSNSEGGSNKECFTYVHEVCYLTKTEYWYNQSIPGQGAIDDDYDAMNAANTKVIAPIWRPDELYTIEIKTNEIIEGTDHHRTHYFAFKTAGPIGHFPLKYLPAAARTQFNLDSNGESTSADQNFDKKVEVAENALKFYIDFNRSYPNPIGNILNQKPLYYEDASLLLFYTAPHVSNFFNNWPDYQSLGKRFGEMRIDIKDPTENSTAPAPTIPPVIIIFPTVVLTWVVDPTPLVPMSIDFINNLRDPRRKIVNFNGDTCWQLGGDPIVPASKNTEIEVKDLLPSKLYNAIVFNKYSKDGVTYHESQIHSYPFQTSRYANLAAQINSYHLETRNFNTGALISSRDAIFNIIVALTQLGTSFNQLKDVVNSVDATNNLNPGLLQNFPDGYQRVLFGYLHQEPLHPPMNTEFNLIYSEAEELIAIWVRNPEPFNDPRIPTDELNNSVQLIIDTQVQTLHPLFSNDKSEIFLMLDSATSSVSDVRVRFHYLLWNGNTYSQSQSIISDSLV